MAEGVKELSDATFDNDVAAGVVLVDFWAPWCGPCKMQGPILEKVAESIGDKATIGKLNVDENTEVAGKFGVQSIPTLVLLKDGNEVNRFVGLQQEDALVSAIESSL